MELISKLNLDKYIFCHPKINLITVYDHYIYLRNDYDNLSHSQRNYVITRLKKFGYLQKSGKTMVHSDDSKFSKIVFSDSPSLGVNPLIALERIYNLNDIFVVTPSTYALFLLASQLTPQDKIEGIKSLISKCPINIEQIRDFTQNTESSRFLDQNYALLNSFQKEVIEKKFKGRKIQL